MPANSRAEDAALLPYVDVTTRPREHFRRRFANRGDGDRCVIAVLVASAISVLFGFPI